MGEYPWSVAITHGMCGWVWVGRGTVTLRGLNPLVVTSITKRVKLKK